MIELEDGVNLFESQSSLLWTGAPLSLWLWDKLWAYNHSLAHVIPCNPWSQEKIPSLQDSISCLKIGLLLWGIDQPWTYQYISGLWGYHMTLPGWFYKAWKPACDWQSHYAGEEHFRVTKKAFIREKGKWDWASETADSHMWYQDLLTYVFGDSDDQNPFSLVCLAFIQRS